MAIETDFFVIEKDVTNKCGTGEGGIRKILRNDVKDIIVPHEIHYTPKNSDTQETLRITRIYWEAVPNKEISNIETLTVLSNPMSIESAAFKDLTSLKYFCHKPAYGGIYSLEIGISSFENTSLEEVDLSMTESIVIKEFAFRNCKNLTTLKISNQRHFNINETAFDGCDNLKQISLVGITQNNIFEPYTREFIEKMRTIFPHLNITPYNTAIDNKGNLINIDGD